MKVDLAEEGQEGAAWLCGRCDDVHMRWLNWTVTLTRAQFEKLARMVETAGKKLAQLRSVPSDESAALGVGKPWLQ